MIGRVTHQTIQRSTLGNLQLNLDAMADLQAKMSGGKKITTPSDDPAGTSDSLRLRAEKRAAEQYARNADDGDAWLTTVDSSLQTSVTALRRARDLAIQGTNGAMGPASREALAVEIEGVRDSLVEQANASYLGRSVFAGTSDAGYAFTGPTGTPPYTFSGTPGATVDRRLSAQTTVRVDADGAAIFGSGSGSVFDAVTKTIESLRKGEDATVNLTNLQASFKNIVSGRAEIGTRQVQLERAGNVNTELEATLDAQKMGIEKADLGSVIMDLKLQETNYQVALAATARVLQPTLMDFLR